MFNCVEYCNSTTTSPQIKPFTIVIQAKMPIKSVSMREVNKITLKSFPIEYSVIEDTAHLGSFLSSDRYIYLLRMMLLKLQARLLSIIRNSIVWHNQA